MTERCAAAVALSAFGLVLGGCGGGGQNTQPSFTLHSPVRIWEDESEDQILPMNDVSRHEQRLLC